MNIWNSLKFSLLVIPMASCSVLQNLEEGGQLGGGIVMTRKDDDVVPALDEMRKIDLVYELDPSNHGSCHTDSGSNLPESRRDAYYPAALRCALDGFYSPEYYNEATEENPELLADLRTSAFSIDYAEGETQRLNALREDLQQLFSQEFFTEADDIVANILTNQANLFNDRIQFAAESAAFIEFQRRRRNNVQSMFMTASDSACDLYKRNLNEIYSRSNFSFGTLATVSGGLGGILTDPGTARGLAGLAGITSGIRAEYNDAFFRNKVVELLTKAMDIARARKKEEIRRRSARRIADYSMEDALDDAVLYNSQCSLVAGLQETSESLQTVSDPGLKWLANAFGGAASDEELTSQLFEALGSAVGTMQEIQQATENLTEAHLNDIAPENNNGNTPPSDATAEPGSANPNQ